MSDLTSIEKIKFEKLFEMSQGYVLNFSNTTFQHFVLETIEIDVYDKKYDYGSGSKANRLRALWKMEANSKVSKLNLALIEVWQDINSYRLDSLLDKDKVLYEECKKISERLGSGSLEEHLEAIQIDDNDKDVEVLLASIRESIEKDKPEAMLDRLHTYVIKYIRQLCEKSKISVDKTKPLHSIYGEFIKHLRNTKKIESDMTERILKSSISVLEAFNTVRNEQSLAHDNQLLNRNESLLIFKNIAATIEFLKTVESDTLTTTNISDDLPF